MPTDSQAADQYLADLSAQSGQGEGFLEGMKNDTLKSIRAAGMMIGLYKPESQAEAKELRTRFMADAALLGVSAATGGVAGGVLKGAEFIGPTARAILSGALAGASGFGASAKIEGQPVLPAMATGAALEMVPFGARAAIKGFVKTGAKNAAVMEAESLLRKGVKTEAETARLNDILAGNAPELAAAGTLTSTRRAYVAKTAGELAARQRIQLAGLTKLMNEMPAMTAANRMATTEREQAATLLSGLETKGVEPFDLPQRTPYQQRVLDPYSVPHTATEAIEDMRAAIPTAVPGGQFNTLKEAIARGTAELPPGDRMTMAVGQTVGKQGRNELGQFTARSIVRDFKIAAGGGQEMSAEAAQVARDAMAEFLDKPPIEKSTGFGEGIHGRRGPRIPVPRRSYATRVENDVAEFLGGPKEAVNIAVGNSVVRNLLSKVPELGGPFSGERLTSLYDDAVGILRRTLVSAGDALKGMGPAGRELAQRMSGTLDTASRRAANSIQNSIANVRLSNEEWRNVAHVLHGDDVPINERVTEIATKIRNELDMMATEAADSKIRVYSPRTGKTKDFVSRNNYFPLDYSKRSIKKYLTPGPEQEEALKRIMESQQGISRTEALAVLRRYLRPEMSEFTYGHLQIARDFTLPGWEEDPRKVLPQYFLQGWKRIETAKEFGAQHEAALGLIGQIGREGGDARLGLDVYNAFANRKPRQFQELINQTRSLNVLSLLSTAGLVQFAQHSNTIALTGWKNYVQGLATFLLSDTQGRRASREWAARTGSYMQEMVQDLVPFNERSWSADFLQFIGLTPLDKANRIVASLAGRYYADDTALKLAKSAAGSAEAQQLERKLAQVGLDPAVVRAQGGILSNEQRSIAAQQASQMTQFRGSVLDMPIAKESAAGQFIYLFKTFAVQQARFNTHLLDEAFNHKNWGPLLRYMAATGTLTAAVGQTVLAVRRGTTIGDIDIPGISPGGKVDQSAARNYLEAILTAGGAGVASDGVRAMFSGPDFLRSFLMGPTANDIFGLLGTDIPQAVQGNPSQALHDAIKHIPLFGRHVANWLVPLE